MARNEEKQQGKLNRLWLRKEREEGRLKDVTERRPKLCTLNSASSVKKWIPSIKNEIEYYLQQSQLTHYPERKIAEFQLQIQTLEREYKRFITKLRILDPTCKHTPWTPRAYCKRRAEAQHSPVTVKTARPEGPNDGGGSSSGCFTATEGSSSFWKSTFQTQTVSTSSAPDTAAVSLQDQPLSFDRTRLAVAAAAFRGPSHQPGSTQTPNLARVLQLGLPNLNSSGLKFLAQNTESSYKNGSAAEKNEETERKTSVETPEKAQHVLGLDCYSSSDEDAET